MYTWKTNREANLSEEIYKIADWIDEKDQLINSSGSFTTIRKKLNEVDFEEVLGQIAPKDIPPIK